MTGSPASMPIVPKTSVALQINTLILQKTAKISL